MIRSKQLLLAAAILNFAIALFQAVISFSPSLSRFFGAWEIASNRALLLVAGLAAAILFAIFGWSHYPSLDHDRPQIRLTARHTPAV